MSDPSPDEFPGLVDDGEGDDGPMSLRRRTARILALLAVALIAVLWGWALFFPPSTTRPGTLTDSSFPDAAEPICTEAAGRLALLPAGYLTPDHVERAAVVARSNVVLGDMVDRLTAIAPALDGSKEPEMIAEWLADWRTYVADRIDYADRLAGDASARFYVTKKDRGQVTRPIDFFAEANHMENCVTPADIE